MTNPDMLHVTLLPSHRQWHRVLKNLQWVVIDEAHSYKGIFGAHVSGVLKRLVRLCRLHGNSHLSQSTSNSAVGGTLQFIYCSATIANPREHFAQLVPLHVLGGDTRLTVVAGDTAPRGEKLLVFWNPPMRLMFARNAQSANNEGIKGKCGNVTPMPTTTGKQQLIEAAMQLNNTEDPSTMKSDVSHKEQNLEVDDTTTSPILQAAGSEERRSKKRSRAAVGTVSAAASKAIKEEARKLAKRAAPPQYCSTGAAVLVAEPVTRTAGGAVRRSSHNAVKKATGSSDASKSGHDRGDESLVDVAESETMRTSTIVETSRLFTSLVKRGVRTLVFSRTRKLTELVLRYSLQDLHATAPELAPLVRGYRGGYTKDERRLIEQDLFRER